MRIVSLFATALLAGVSSRQQDEQLIGSGAHQFRTGQVTPTKNPQVASYSLALPSPADVYIKVSDGTEAGFSTWKRRASGNGEPVRILVAGMRANTRYALQAHIHFLDGTVVEDDVHWFKTGALPQWTRKIKMTVTQEPGAILQPGVELMNSIKGPHAQAFVSDLQGHILWAYDMPDHQSKRMIGFLRWKDRIRERIERFLHAGKATGPLRDSLAETACEEAAAPMMKEMKRPADTQMVNPVKLLPNGNMLLLIGLPSHALLVGPLPHGAHSMLREIDLTGEIIRELSIEALNEKLHAAGYKHLQLQMFHHDVEVLPNGHWVVIANQFRAGSKPGQGQVDIFGDVLIDLDTNLNPVWVWDTFDHLDIGRRPMWSPNWTHGNAVVYTPEDGNLLFSMRDQSWVIKINYGNGQGDGKVLWRLGRDGDFRLLGGQEPTDWQYGQHMGAIVGSRSAGVFRLIIVDNGNARPMPNGCSCAEKQTSRPDQPLCYTTIPMFEIDEGAKTARVLMRKVFPDAEYSTWGGNANLLANGDMKVTLSSQRARHTSLLVEYVPDNNNHEIWRMRVEGFPIYRAHRIGSLYPGVQW